MDLCGSDILSDAFGFHLCGLKSAFHHTAFTNQNKTNINRVGQECQTTRMNRSNTSLDGSLPRPVSRITSSSHSSSPNSVNSEIASVNAPRRLAKFRGDFSGPLLWSNGDLKESLLEGGV
jgi:hypothetical protein